MGETKGYFQIGKFFLKKIFCYQFTNKKNRKSHKFGLNNISGSNIMQKKNKPLVYGKC